MVDKADRKTLTNALEFFHPVGCLIGGHIDRTCDLVKLPPKFAQVPVVYLDRDPFPKGNRIFCAAHDSKETGRQAAKELLDLGLSSYGYVAWNAPPYWNTMRREGFAHELQSCGLHPAVFASSGVATTTRLRKLGKWLVKLPRPVGIFAANDRMAADVLLVADQVGLKVPTDLVVIGVDNNLAICTSSEPTITSIAPDFERGGYLAARLLDERIADPKMKPTTRWFRPHSIVRRDSTARTATGNPPIDKALALINEKACSGLKAKDVIALLPGSRRYVERDFLRRTGKTILQTIIDVRMEKAKALLQNPSCQLSTVAAQCGWISPNYLRRIFQKRMRMSMSDWRKQNTYG